MAVRSQAVEALLQTTNQELHDWFTMPDNVLDRKPFARMLELAEHGFVGNLLRNRHASFPGGSFSCLQARAVLAPPCRG